MRPRINLNAIASSRPGFSKIRQRYLESEHIKNKDSIVLMCYTKITKYYVRCFGQLDEITPDMAKKLINYDPSLVVIKEI
jgi:hypothetical protein